MANLAAPAPGAVANFAKRLRVLHVNSGNLYGGVETILATLARLRHLCPSMEPSFALCHEGRLSRELTATGAPVHLIGQVRVRHPLTVWRARRRMRELLRRERFDAVICHMSWTEAVFGPVVRSSQIPLVFYVHNRVEGRNWLERWARFAARPDLALCVSHDTARTCPSMYPTVRREVIYSPMPMIQSQPLDQERPHVRAELQTSEHATVLLQVSRMEAWKGHAFLLEALGRLEKRSDWVCWIVGGPQTPAERIYAEGLKAQAVRLGIADRVRFAGERTDVARVMAAADVLCQPNRSTEGFSIVFMEAFLASLPIVTSALGGALEMVDDSCGRLIPLDDMDALTAALRELLDKPDLRKALGRSGYNRVHQLCDPATQMSKLKGVLAGLANGKLGSH